jgi:hypothetical protein
MMEGIALILLSNLGTRFLLRGVGYDAPGFWISIFTAKDRISWVKPANTGQT